MHSCGFIFSRFYSRPKFTGVDLVASLRFQTESLETAVRQLRLDLSNKKRLMEIGTDAIISSTFCEDLRKAGESLRRLSFETATLKTCTEKVGYY